MSNKMGILSKQTLYIKDYSLPIDVVCKSCPELSQYLQRRTLKIDLSDPNALKVYNQCLFWILEGLKIQIPNNHLIPTAGLRRAIVDIITQQISPKTVIEVGCGPSAIISLLLAKRNIYVHATEIDPQSYNLAHNSIINNTLEHKITLYKSSGGILAWLSQEYTEIFPIDIVISLPPFYEKNSYKPYASKGFRGTDLELYAKGSAESFAVNLLNEAIEVYPRINKVGLLWKNEESMIKGFNEINNLDLSTRVFELIAGTRKRYFTITNLQQIKEVSTKKNKT